MAEYVRIGDAVFHANRVKMARVQDQPQPELWIMLRGPDETVIVAAPTDAEAEQWLGELGARTEMPRVGPALVPVQRVHLAQAVATHQLTVGGQAQERGPALQMNLQGGEKVYLSAPALEIARAWLDELLQVLNTPRAQRIAAPPEVAPESQSDVDRAGDGDADADATWPITERAE